jgi:hypothetical protein
MLENSSNYYLLVCEYQHIFQCWYANSVEQNLVGQVWLIPLGLLATSFYMSNDCLDSIFGSMKHKKPTINLYSAFC